MPARPPLDARLYRAGLTLCPPAFHREFSAEMLRDFGDARAEALSANVPGLWPFRRRMASDLVRCLLVQWLRTGWPAIALASALGPLFAGLLIDQLWRRVPGLVPGGPADTELLAIELMVLVTLFVLVATMVAALWSARFVRRLGRR